MRVVRAEREKGRRITAATDHQQGDAHHWTRVCSPHCNDPKQESPEEWRGTTLPGLTADTTVFAIGLRYGGMWSVPRGARDCPQGVALEARHSVCAGTACTGSGLCFVRRCLHQRGKHTLSKNAPQHKSDRQSRNAHRLKLDAALHPIQHTSTRIGPAHRRNRSKSVIFDSFLRIFMS